jgi:hypothetical protein
LRAAGHPRSSGPVVVFPLLHPAAALRSRRWAERWDRDVSSLGKWLRADAHKHHTVRGSG